MVKEGENNKTNLPPIQPHVFLANQMLQTTALPGLYVPSMQMGAQKCHLRGISNIII